MVLLGAGATSAAGEPSTPAASPVEWAPRVFVAAGAGVSSVGPLGMGSLTIEVASWQVVARGAITGGIDLDISPTEEVIEEGGMVGRAWRRGARTFYLAGGLARASTTRRGKFIRMEDSGLGTAIYEAIKADTWGVPVEAGVAWDSRIVGFGLAFVGDVNLELSYFGIAASVRLGKTR